MINYLFLNQRLYMWLAVIQKDRREVEQIHNLRNDSTTDGTESIH